MHSNGKFLASREETSDGCMCVYLLLISETTQVKRGKRVLKMLKRKSHSANLSTLLDNLKENHEDKDSRGKTSTIGRVVQKVACLPKLCRWTHHTICIVNRWTRGGYYVPPPGSLRIIIRPVWTLVLSVWYRVVQCSVQYFKKFTREVLIPVCPWHIRKATFCLHPGTG